MSEHPSDIPEDQANFTSTQNHVGPRIFGFLDGATTISISVVPDVNFDLPIVPTSPQEEPQERSRRMSVKEARAARREMLRREGGEFENAWLPAEDINVLPQPRKTFDHIDEMGESLAAQRFINPPNVAQLDEPNARKYLEGINKVHKTDIQLEDLNSTQDTDGNIVWNILMAGERRFRGCKHLKEYGCEDCQSEAAEQATEEESQAVIKGCYVRHFGREEIEVRLGKNMSARSALNLQSAENMHVNVPPHEDADFLYSYWMYIKEEDPLYPLAAFAKDAGRSEETIRDAIKYCTLPDVVRDFVEHPKEGVKQFPYGAAVEMIKLLRIKDHTSMIEMQSFGDYLDWKGVDREGNLITGRFYEMTDDELVGWVNKFYIGGRKMDEFRDSIAKYVREREGGQQDMFVIMSEEQMRAFELQQRKKIVEARVIQALHNDLGYLMTLEIFQEDGRLGLPESPYGTGSPVRILLKNAELMRKIAQDLKNGISGSTRKQIIDAAEEVIPVFEALIGQDTEILEGQESFLLGHHSNGNSANHNYDSDEVEPVKINTDGMKSLF